MSTNEFIGIQIHARNNPLSMSEIPAPVTGGYFLEVSADNDAKPVMIEGPDPQIGDACELVCIASEGGNLFRFRLRVKK